MTFTSYSGVLIFFPVEDFSPLISFSAGGWIDSSNDPDISVRVY